MSRRDEWPPTARLVLATLAMGALLLRGAFAQSTGTITTVAGGGPGTLPGPEASLLGNVKVVADSVGNLYVSHGLGHRVYRLDAGTGTLSPLAGSGFRGYAGDGGPALQAQLDNPYGLALDERQNRLYIAEVNNNVIRAVDLTTGLISTVAGTGTCGYSGDDGPATSARLCNLLSDLALDANGILYFATDFGGWRIRTVEDGIIRTLAGNGVVRGAIDGQGGDPADDYRDRVAATSTSLGAVTALAVDPSGVSLYFFEQAVPGGARIRRVDLEIFVLTTYAGNGLVYGQIDGPGGDPSDDVVEGAPALQSALGYTTSMALVPGTEDLDAVIYTLGLVRRVASDGARSITTVVGGGASPPLGVPPLSAGLMNPTGISHDGNGTLYLAAGSHLGSGAEVYASTLTAIGPVVGNGYAAYCGDGGPATAACLNAPTAARLDPDGTLIIADDGNQVVRAVSGGGTIGTLIPALFSRVADLWPLAPGQFLYTDTATHTVYHAEPPYTGFTAVAGTGTATGSLDGPGGDPADDLNDGELAWVASLHAPAGLARDDAGHTFIADSANHRVRRIDAVTGVISTVAGTGTAGFNGDGLAGTATELALPYGLAFDHTGDLLVSEREGHRVRRFAAGDDGLVTGAADEIATTVAGTGVAAFFGDGEGATSSAVSGPTGLAVDVLGHLYVADTGNHAIRKVDRQTGVIETIAGRGTQGDGVPAVSSQLGAPVHLTTAVHGDTRYLYVTDSQQHRVRRIDLGPAQPPANQPPVVDPLGLNGATLSATSPAGATVGLYANASDPDGDPLTYTWSGPFGTATGNGVAVLLPIGVRTLAVEVDDGQGHVVSERATVTVLGENTYTGNGEVVTPPDDHQPRRTGETSGRVSVTFLGPVTTPGLTWLRTRTDQTPPPPAGQQLGSAPFYYDIATTAVAGGDVRICLDLTGMSFAFPGQVELHRLGGGWTGLGVSPDPVSHVVCAQAPFAQAFGTYANFTPADPVTRVATVAGTGAAADTGDGGPAINAGLNVPEGLAFDRARNLLYIGSGSHRVRRVDLTDGRIETMAGTGAVEDPVDGVDARFSSIGSISGLALDAEGNLFIGDQSHCLVRRVDRRTNVITTVGGRWRGPGLTCGHTGDGGAATAARLGFPHRLAFDAAGNLLTAESPTLAGDDGGYIRRIAAGLDGRVTGDDPGETITTIAGNGQQDVFVSSGVHPLSAGIYPFGLAVGPGGQVYVAENNGVLLLGPGADGVLDGSADERVIRVFGTPLGFSLPFQGDGGPALDAYADFTTGLAALPSGDLLVTSPNLRRMRRISAGANGVVDGSADERIGTIAGFSDDSEPPAFNGDGYALPTRFAWPVELVADGADAIYVADSVFHRVRRFGPPSGDGGGDASADLSIAGSAAPDPVAPGSVLTYRPTVANKGPGTAHAVRVSLEVPATVDFVGSVPAACGGPAAGTAGTIVCDLGDLPAGGASSIVIETRPGAAGPLALALTVSANETDPNPANNSANVSVVVRLDPVVLEVVEDIVVTDEPLLTPSVLLNVPESIVVTEEPKFTTSVMLNVAEAIVVTDSAALTPSVLLNVAENILVADAASFPDTTPPSVTINQAAGQADPASGSPIEFSVMFNEPVLGFGGEDVSFAGSTVGGALSASVTGSGASYSVSVSGMSGAGTVVASIPAGAAVDAAGNPSAASTSTDNAVTLQAATTTSLASSRNPSLTTAPPIFTATVGSAPGAPPTGQVEFRSDGVAFGRSGLFERGGQWVAVLGGGHLDVAGSPHTVTARYLGDAAHLASSSAALQQAVQAGTYYMEAVAAPIGFAPAAFNDAGRIAGNRGTASVSRAGVFDPGAGYRNLDSGADFSQASDLNAAGAVVGRSGLDAATTTGFVDRNGVLEPIPASTSATGVNSREQIAINLEDGSAAIQLGGSTTVLEAFEARAINDAGAVVGALTLADGEPGAVLWAGGVFTELGRFGQATASATHVNNAGTVLIHTADSGEPSVLLFRDGLETPLGIGRPWDINDADVVVAGTDRVQVYVGSTWTTLAVGTVKGIAVNNLGQIVGSVSNQLKRWTPVPTSALVVSPVSAFDDDEIMLTAALTSQGAPVAGQQIVFSLAGSVVGSGTTGPDGVATLTGVFSGLPIGVQPEGVRASFPGSPALGDSTATAQLTIQATDPADLAVWAATATPSAPVGTNITYYVLVANLGPSNAQILKLNVALPAGLQYLGDSGAGACSWLPGLGSCNFAPVAVGQAGILAIVARSTTPGPLTATFGVSGLRHDPYLANNSAAVTVDAPPTVTINQAAGQTDPAHTPPVRFTVVFSEPVTGFSGGDVSFAGSTVGGTLAAAVTGSGANYTVSVTGMTGAGLVAVSIPAGAAVDGGGKPNTASTSTDRSVLFGVSLAYGSVQPSNGGNIVFSVVNWGGQPSGVLSFSRGNVSYTATRITSFVVSGQTATIEGFSSTGRLFVAALRDGGPGQPDGFRLWIEGVEQTAGGGLSGGSLVIEPWTPDTRLKGWVDLHTHPMSNLAFGGKLFHGAPSTDSLMPSVQMPSDPVCRHDKRATGIAEALSQDGPTRGDNFQSQCGNLQRNLLIKAIEAANGANTAPAGADGFPAFTYWPHWNDITHQKMWIEWIRRSWQYGQRVMVALSHNNRPLAGVLGGGGPISGVTDDKASSDLQVDEIKKLVTDHSDFMAVAKTPDELRSIVAGGRLAVVLGVELDNLGNLNRDPRLAVPGLGETLIDNEVARLHAQGVRYILPIHLIDNMFGDTALYEDVYNLVNFSENGSFWAVGCAQRQAEVGFQNMSLPPVLAPLLAALGVPVPPAPPSCLFNVPGLGIVFNGHVNARTTNGLTGLGEFAIRAMMKRGMIVDIDHMSDRAANRTLARAAAVPGGGYPVMSGHTGVRNRTEFGAENSRTTTQLASIACLGGMFGLGSGVKSGTRAVDWTTHYARGYEIMRRAFAPGGLCPQETPLGVGFIGLGTDTNSLVKTPRAPMFDPVQARFTPIYDPNHPVNVGVSPLARPPRVGNTTWDYNFDGVAHYGMFADFLRDVRTLPANATMSGRQVVDDQLMYGADYFYRMWLKADVQKVKVP